jgi:alanine-glyoxylate transaminase/(R)-3-amino-2-methylpropionate-pyruvate transaminase
MKAPELPPYDYQPRPYRGPSYEEVLRLKNRYVTPTSVPNYKTPLMIVEGSMQYLFDHTGRRYLDVIGGIVTISVGHCHPYVVQKVKEQTERLQHITSIYLHPNIGQYAEMLASKLPDDLSVCYFVNSGSEANDMALLMARLYTGNYDAVALRNAYHGGSASTMQLTAHSTWKYNYPHSFGVHHAINPDPYRGPWGHDDPQAGAKYAAEIKNLIDYATPGRVAAFFAESIQGVGGTVVYPDGFLKGAYEIVRSAGGLCIADEVQTGFTRTGTHYWGFENHGVIPDIVTMAKGIGNGVPLAAVVTTPKIATALASRIHFNTFGGNPVSCAAGMAVLEIIDRENLQKNCLERGNQLMDGQAQHHRRCAWPGPHDGDRAREGPENERAGAGGMPAGLRAGEGFGTAHRKGRPPCQHATDQTANVHHQGRCAFSSGCSRNRFAGSMIPIVLPSYESGERMFHRFH